MATYHRSDNYEAKERPPKPRAMRTAEKPGARIPQSEIEKYERVAAHQRAAVNEASEDTDWTDAGQRKRWGGKEPYVPVKQKK